MDAADPRRPTGYWVPTRAEDLRAILTDTDHFSSDGVAGFSALIGESWPLIPAELDQPEHTKFRQFLNPMFSVTAMKAWVPRAREFATLLIDDLVKGDQCEFQSGFARPFPIRIFLEVMGLSQSRFDDIVAWGHDLHEGMSMAQRVRGATAIGVFLRDQIAAVRRTPRDGVLSRIVNGDIEGHAFTDDEIIGMVYLLFTGGIHTVTASLGFQFDHLGRNPELQTRLRGNPDLIPAAIEELLRAYSVVNSFRLVTKDIVIAGITMKAGDWVQIPLPIVNYDVDAFANPDTINIDRKANRHFAFSSGIHFCLGLHLARQEMRIAWEEWLQRIPPFRVSEQIQVSVGPLLGVDKLVLGWS